MVCYTLQSSNSTTQYIIGYTSKLTKMVKADETSVKLYEFNARVGLNGSHCQWSFPCLLNEENMCFFVWLGDVTIDKFTKTTFMNLDAFAEKAGATKMVFIQDRDHAQKCTQIN